MADQYELIKYKGRMKIKKVEDELKDSQFHLTEEELKKVEDNAPSNRDRVMIELMGRCGLRRNEARSLKIEDIDFGRGFLHLKITKRSKRRSVPVPRDTLRELKWLVGKRQTGWVFLSKRGHRLSNTQINRIVAKAGENAGITPPNPKKKHIHPHMLRHTFAWMWKHSGKRMDILQLVLGHSTITTTTEMYGTPSLSDIKEEFEKESQI